MKNISKIKLFLVDDDAILLKLLAIEFEQQGDYIIETYPTGELCLAHLSHNPDVIVLDYHLDGIQENAINGLETLDRIKELKPKIPVVMLSSQDKIEVAINCMHHKAFDYVVKSETAFMRLEKNIKTILEFENIEKKLNWYKQRM